MSSAAGNGKGTHAMTGGRVAATAGSGSASGSSSGSVDKPGMSVDKSGKSVDKAGRSVDKPGAKPKSKMTPEQQRQMLVVVIAAMVVLGVAVGLYAYFFSYRGNQTHGEVRLDATPEVMVPFIASDKFDKLPWHRKEIWFKEMATKKKEVEELFKGGKLSKPQAEDALSVCWFGKELKEESHFYSLGGLDQKDYLDKLLDKEAESNTEPKDLKKNKLKVKSLEEQMPQDNRTLYEAFHRALKDRKKERESEARKIKAAARAAATRPTTRPANTPPAAAPAPGVNGAKPLSGNQGTKLQPDGKPATPGKPAVNGNP
jgi:hypothetical protein